MAVAAVVAAPAARALDDDLATTLDRATAQVEDFFLRAQSLVCTETVHLQPLNSGLTGDGFGRTVESELRLSWTPGEDGEGATEAQTMRQVTRVNGHTPRKKDHDNCTTPEQHDTETQVLSMLLRGQREDYTWKLAGVGKVDGRPTVQLDFREKAKVTVDVKLVENNEDCISYDINGGLTGRLWLDAETYDVLRMDHHMGGQIQVPMPREVRRRPGMPAVWTVERLDTTYRFKRVQFTDPTETIVLPVSSTSLRVTNGAGTPRMRVTTEYKKYRRFLTGGRIVPGDGQP
jgi:hypothetical protein